MPGHEGGSAPGGTSSEGAASREKVLLRARELLKLRQQSRVLGEMALLPSDLASAQPQPQSPPPPQPPQTKPQPQPQPQPQPNLPAPLRAAPAPARPQATPSSAYALPQPVAQPREAPAVHAPPALAQRARDAPLQPSAPPPPEPPLSAPPPPTAAPPLPVSISAPPPPATALRQPACMQPHIAPALAPASPSPRAAAARQRPSFLEAELHLAAQAQQPSAGEARRRQQSSAEAASSKEAQQRQAAPMPPLEPAAERGVSRPQRPSAQVAARAQELLTRESGAAVAASFLTAPLPALVEAAPPPDPSRASAERPSLASLLGWAAQAAPAQSGPLFVSDAMLDRVRALRPGAPPLARLDLSGCRGVTPEAVLRLAAAHAASLTHLWAAGGQLWTVGQAEALLAAAPRLQLAELDLRAGAACAALLRLLQGESAVRPRRLLFRAPQRDPHAALALARALQANETLRALELKGQVQWRGLPALLQASVENVGLEGLTLESLGVGPAEAAFLAGQLAAHEAHVESLSLAGNALGEEGVEALARWLASDGTLQVLDLRRTGCGAQGCEALAVALGRASAPLRSLRLGGNALRAAGAESLGGLLARSWSLEALDLSECGLLGGPGIRPLTDALCGERLCLRRLGLRGNRVGDGGAANLGDMLRFNRTLRELDVGENGVTAEGAGALAAGVRANGGVLVSLALENNAIGDAGWRALEAIRTPTLALFLG